MDCLATGHLPHEHTGHGNGTGFKTGAAADTGIKVNKTRLLPNIDDKISQIPLHLDHFS